MVHEPMPSLIRPHRHTDHPPALSTTPLLRTLLVYFTPTDERHITYNRISQVKSQRIPSVQNEHVKPIFVFLHAHTDRYQRFLQILPRFIPKKIVSRLPSRAQKDRPITSQFLQTEKTVNISCHKYQHALQFILTICLIQNSVNKNCLITG